MPTYSPDPLHPKELRCDVCHRGVVAVHGPDLPAIPGMTAQQVIQARPEVAAHVSQHESECPAAQKAEGTGPWRRFAREARWSWLLLSVGVGLIAGSLLLSPDALPGGLADRVIYPLLLWVGGLLALLGLWWTIRTLVKVADQGTMPGGAWPLILLVIILLLGGGALLFLR